VQARAGTPACDGSALDARCASHPPQDSSPLQGRRGRGLQHGAVPGARARGRQARAVVECGRVLDVAARHAGAMREAADQLAFLHGELEALRAPAWNVPTAADVLLTGAALDRV